MAIRNINSIAKQSALIGSLMKADAYPHPVSSFELFETHISWVILTGPFAYKIKKAVRLDFLDFGTLDRRRKFCDEELRLNRQWAPTLYLAVVPICGSVDRPSIGGDGPVIEYAVKMVQFPQGAQLDEQLSAGLLQEKDVYDLAETIAGYHGQATIIEYANDRESVGKVTAPMLDNFAPLRQTIDMDLLTRIQQWTRSSLQDLKPTLIQRRKDGFVRECHGDLHLANLVRLPEGIVAFDCVEFSAELRNIDVISDVAFLFMDLVARARQDLAYICLNRYLECTGDYSGLDVFGLYVVYHCMIRAKVAAIRSMERTEAEGRQEDIGQVKHNLAVAARWIDSREPRLVAMHGYSGSGKTWLSSLLMAQLPAIRVRSDIERKRLVGLDETASSGSQPGEGAYTDQAKGHVYARLIEIVEGLLAAGFDVIVDASFLRQTERQRFAALADRNGVPFVFVETIADDAELVRRLQERATGNGSASEADTDVLSYQYENSDPLTVGERKKAISIATDTVIDASRIIKALTRITG